uniref:Uncharacterized protein n=1 Tax=viral metagenome TaxID=1070528 RepID=A0A6C0I4C5_9ZZZZ
MPGDADLDLDLDLDRGRLLPGVDILPPHVFLFVLLIRERIFLIIENVYIICKYNFIDSHN